MSWTRNGTISVTNGSANIVGASTTWLTDGLTVAGDTLIVAGSFYEIAANPSDDTHVTIVGNYTGTTASGLSYSIIHTGLLPAVLASNLSTLQTKYLLTVQQLLDWETAVSGTVPITNPATGVTVNVVPLQLAAANTSVWRSGSGAPSNSLGINGDYYLNIVNGDVYYKATGTYSVVTNIRGATGANSAAMQSRFATMPGNLLAFTGNNRMYPPFTITLDNVSVSVGTAGTFDAIFNIRKNGSAIFTSSKPTITAGSHLSAPAATGTVTLLSTDYMTVDCEQGGGCSEALMRIDYH